MTMTAPAAAPPARGSARPRLLCVDDEPGMLAGLSRVLRPYYEVRIAEGGQAGIDALERDPDVAVVMSDLRMPVVDGVAFLARARELAPDATRVMLTGHADLDAAVKAVNQGNVFRILTKPARPEELLATLDAAAEQHRLVTAQRELLEQTLRGSVRALLDTLALANPMAFARAMRVRHLVGHLAEVSRAPDPWEVEVAAMLSQIGAVTLPEDVVSKLHRGDELTSGEHQAVDRLPAIAEHLLADIPRLGGVREIIRYQHTHYDGSGPPHDGRSGPDLPLGARILKVALDLDQLRERGMAHAQAIATLAERPGVYDGALLSALRWAELTAVSSRPIAIDALAPGMVLGRDVCDFAGRVVAGKGQDVTPTLVARLQGALATRAVPDTVYVTG